MSFDPEAVQSALLKAWSRSTASQWTADNPAAGQCNVTSLLVHELFGGDLLKTPLPAGDHFYNRIEGKRYDFTNLAGVFRAGGKGRIRNLLRLQSPVDIVAHPPPTHTNPPAGAGGTL